MPTPSFSPTPSAASAPPSSTGIPKALQIKGETEQTLPAGSAFCEPAGRIIASFGNASHPEYMTFIAIYQLDGDQILIQML
jgi:hypothetical protein